MRRRNIVWVRARKGNRRQLTDGRKVGLARAREDGLDVAWEAGMTEAVLPVAEEVPQREEVEGVGEDSKVNDVRGVEVFEM